MLLNEMRGIFVNYLKACFVLFCFVLFFFCFCFFIVLPFFHKAYYPAKLIKTEGLQMDESKKDNENRKPSPNLGQNLPL